MPAAFHAEKIAERALAGVQAQLVDHAWDAGAEMHYAEQAIVLRLRLRLQPDRLEAVAVLDDGATAPFGRLMLWSEGDRRTRAAHVDEQARVASCRFQRSWFEEFVSDQGALPDEGSGYVDLYDGNLSRTMARLAAELTSPGFGGDAMIDSLVSMAGIDLVRHRLNADSRKTLADRGRLSPAQLRRIGERVVESLQDAPTIPDLARDIGLSASHLRRLFRNSTGMTLHEHIAEVRIERARHFLANSRLPLKVISHRIGFRHPSAFSTAFQRATGESPRAYRLRSGGTAV